MRVNRLTLTGFLLTIAFVTVPVLGDFASDMKRANELHRTRQYDEAVALYNKLLAHDEANAGNKVSILKAIASTYGSARKYTQAIAACDKATQLLANKDDRQHNELRRLRARMCSMAGRHDEALTELKTIIDQAEKSGNKVPTAVYLELGQAYARQGEFKSAVEAYTPALAQGPITYGLVHTVRDLMFGHIKHVKVDDPDAFAALLRRAVVEGAADQAVVSDQAMHALVKFLIGQGDFARAVYEAKIFMQVAPPAYLDSAADLLSVAVRATDGSIARVNAFLEYKRYGSAGADGKPGTDDDLTNPLETIRPIDEKQRDAIFLKGIERYDTDWKGQLARARVYRYWGKPREALKTLQLAFTLCPMKQESLQLVSDQVVDVLIQVSGDAKAGEAFVAFQEVGPAGPDKKFGTKDDLSNPIDRYLRVE